MVLSEDAVLKIYEEHDAVWSYGYRRGDSTLPHAELTSSLCADGYFRSDFVLQDPVVAVRLATSMVEKLHERRVARQVQWVVGSAYGGIVFAYEVARQLGVHHAYTVKDPTNPKCQLWRMRVPGGAVVLRCEDVISTRGTVHDVERAIVAGNPEPVTVLSDVATIVCHPGGGIEDIDIIRLLATRVRIWHQSECPLCKQGSPRLRPKGHWRELTGK